MPGPSVHDAPLHLQLPEWKRDLLRRLAGLQSDTAHLYFLALQRGNIGLALQAIQRSEKQLWLEWQIIEEPQAASAVNVAVLTDNSPRDEIMRRLGTITRRRALQDGQTAPHPEQ